MIPEASNVVHAEIPEKHVPVFIEWGTLLLPVDSFDARRTSDRPEGD